MIYRLDDLVESHDFEHDQKFVKAEHWRDACDELNDKTKTVRELEKELTELREFKREALGVIGFYGNNVSSVWNSDGSFEMGDSQLAREFLTKHNKVE